MEREAFLMKSKHQCHLSQYRERVYGAQSWKEKRLLCESLFVLIDRWTLILKNCGNKSFLNETKESMSYIPIMKMTLWCSITKKKEVAMWICACPNQQMNFNSKNDEKRSFYNEIKTSMSFIPM